MERLLTTILDLIVRFDVDFFVFEESTFSHWIREHPLFDLIRQRCTYRAQKTTGASKGHHQYGLASMTADFETGKIRLPYGDEEARQMTDSLADELTNYPDYPRDDQIMALWFGKALLRRLGPRHRGAESSYFEGASPGERTWNRFKRQDGKDREAEVRRQMRQDRDLRRALASAHAERQSALRGEQPEREGATWNG